MQGVLAHTFIEVVHNVLDECAQLIKGSSANGEGTIQREKSHIGRPGP
jgi:hypothetical protein